MDYLARSLSLSRYETWGGRVCRPEQPCRFLLGGGASPHPGQSADAGSNLGTSSSAGEARDFFNAGESRQLLP